MKTTRTLKIGTIATFAAVAVLTGCGRDEPETGTSSSTTTITPSAPSSPGTPGYVGPGSGSSPSSPDSSSSSSTMTTPPASTSDPASSSSSSSSSSSPPGSTSSSDTTTPTPGSSGYVGGSSSTPAPSDPASTSGSSSSGTGSSSMDSAPAGSSGTSGSSGSSSGTAPSGSSGSGSTPGSPSSSLDGADRPFRDVAVAGPNDRSLGPVAWRKLLGVDVIRVAEEDATRGTGQGASQSGMADESKAGSQKLSKKDRKFLDKAATSGMFEVEAARLAADRASDPQVKSFAAKLLDHHQQANEELKQLASARGVTLPSKLASKEQAMLDRLSKASDDKFDQEFLKTVGLRDHKQDIRQFENAQNQTNDAELKAWIAKTLPTLRTHLAEAQSMSGDAVKMQGYTGSGEAPKSGSDAGKEAPKSGSGY